MYGFLGHRLVLACMLTFCCTPACRGSKGGVVGQVHEIALQTTTFVKWDGARIVLPNSYLFANILTNMTRSSDKADIFKVNSQSVA